MSKQTQFKINLHITQRCNYRCRYCFAHFDKGDDLTAESWLSIIDNIRQSGLINAINFAGGEAELHPAFPTLMRYAHENGFRLSLITNGSLILKDRFMMDEGLAMLDTLGISADSFTPATLQRLRCAAGKHVLVEEDLAGVITAARSIHPGIRIKVNTVVSKENANETLAPAIQRLGIDRWKILKMKAFRKGAWDNSPLAIDNATFRDFVLRNSGAGGEIIPEETLTRSYIMVDSHGNLVDDDCENYRIIGNLLSEDFACVFARYPLNHKLYHNRYTGLSSDRPTC